MPLCKYVYTYTFIYLHNIACLTLHLSLTVPPTAGSNISAHPWDFLTCTFSWARSHMKCKDTSSTPTDVKWPTRSQWSCILNIYLKTSSFPSIIILNVSSAVQFPLLFCPNMSYVFLFVPIIPGLSLSHRLSCSLFVFVDFVCLFFLY